MNRIKESQLRSKLLELIEQDFAEITSDRVAVILSQLARDFEGRAPRSEVLDRSSFGRRADSSQLPEQAPTRRVPTPSAESSSSGALRAPQSQQVTTVASRSPEVTPAPASPTPAPSASDSSSSAAIMEDGATITLMATEPEQIGDLLHQLLEVGAVLVQLSQPRSLNALVTLRVDFRPMQFVVEVVGRVVNISTRGTAIEVSQLQREDRAALEQVMARSRMQPPSPSRSHAAVEPPQPNRPLAPPTPAQTATMEFGRTLSSGRMGATVMGSPMTMLKRSHNEPMIVMRRPVELTTPDVKMVTELTRVRQTISMAGELYGPGPSWAKRIEDPERIEALAADRILDILLQQSEHAFSGVVEIERSDKSQHQLKFDSGFLVDIVTRPRNADHELGPMLLMANRIDKQQLSMAAAHADEHQVSVGRALLDLDLIDAEALRHAVAGRLTFLLRDVLLIDEGQASVISGQSMTPGFLPLPPLRVHLAVERPIFASLFERLRQHSQRARDARVQQELDAYPETSEADRERLERALIEPAHLSFIQDTLNGRRRLREVFTESTLPGPETFALVFALHRMGLVSFDHSLHHTVVRERYRENVTVKYLSVHKASYFEVLNVHWSSYDEVVRKAYEELVAQFDPAQMPERIEPDVAQRVREIRERVEAAYQALAKRDSRHSYRMRIMPEYKLSHAIPLFLKQCELAEKRRQRDEACDSLRRVLEIAPEHADAAHWRQRLRALESGQAEIEADVSSSSF